MSSAQQGVQLVAGEADRVAARDREAVHDEGQYVAIAGLEGDPDYVQLQERRDLDAIVLLVPKSDECGVGSDSILLQNGVSISSSFEAKVATVYRFVSVAHESVTSFRVPVLAVLDGSINGFEASLALASDWRVATSGTTLHAKQAGLDPFQVCEKILSLCRQDKRQG